MPKLIVIEHTGKDHELDAEIGQSVMDAVVSAGVDGIVAECGGGCACATCHCFVDDEWMDRVGEANDVEATMLDYTAVTRESNSRLSCQIDMSEELDGLVVRLPSQQF